MFGQTLTALYILIQSLIYLLQFSFGYSKQMVLYVKCSVIHFEAVQDFVKSGFISKVFNFMHSSPTVHKTLQIFYNSVKMCD